MRLSWTKRNRIFIAHYNIGNRQLKKKRLLLYDLKFNQNVPLKMKTERTFTGVCKGKQSVQSNTDKKNVTIFKLRSKENNSCLISASTSWQMALLLFKQRIYVQQIVSYNYKLSKKWRLAYSTSKWKVNEYLAFSVHYGNNLKTLKQEKQL